MRYPCSEPFSWHHFSPFESDAFPALPCCYVIYLDGRLSYVGSTENFNKRMKSHMGVKRANWELGCFTKFEKDPFFNVLIKAKFSIRKGDWLMREKRLISRLRPQYNEKI